MFSWHLTANKIKVFYLYLISVKVYFISSKIHFRFSFSLCLLVFLWLSGRALC